MTFMEQEILSQPHLLKASIEKNRQTFLAIKESFKDANVKTIIYAARGSSDNAGIYFKYLIEIKLGLPVSLSAPSVLTKFNGKINFQNTLVIGVSQSGKAEDVCAVLSEAKQQGAMTVAITNDMTSPLAMLAQFTLDLAVDKEISVAATKTFTAELVLLACLAQVLDSNKSGFQEIIDTISLMETIFSKKNELASLASQLEQKNNVFVLARGYVYTVAKELALKMQETSYIQALSYSSSDFYHGPIAMIDENSLVIMIMPDDQSYEDNHELYLKIKGITDKIVVFSDKENASYDRLFLIPKTTAELSPILYAVTAQLYALEVAKTNNFNPDVPRNLKKVTITK